MNTNHRDLHQAIDQLTDAQAARVTDFLAALLAEEEEAEPEPEGTHNGSARGAGWIERRMVGKWGPYRYHCWYGPNGRKHAKYLGKDKD